MIKKDFRYRKKTPLDFENKKIMKEEGECSTSKTWKSTAEIDSAW